MHKNKLIQVFYKLSAAEKVAFRKFVYSPYFNKQEECRLLLDYIYQIDPQKGRERLDRHATFAAVFPQRPFDMPKLRYCMSDLMQLLEQFLVQQLRKKKALDFQLDLVQVYEQMQLDDLAQQALDAAYHLQRKNESQDIIQLEYAYQLEWLTYKTQAQKDRSEAQNLQLLNDTFDIAYIAAKLKHSCRILSYQGMFAKQYDNGMLDALLFYLQQRPNLLEVPAIGLYYFYFMSVTSVGQGAGYFAQFKQFLFQYQQVFPVAEIHDLYKLATNYSIKKLNTADRSFYLQETFELYQEALQHGFLLENEQISPFAFTNIVAIALGLEKEGWAWDFIQAYSPRLEAVLRQPYTDYNLSRWYFHQKEYQKAEALLVAEDFDDLHLHLSAKMLLVKIYYELGEYPLLDALINRFKTFLSRKKVLGYHKKNYTNILRFTQRLTMLNPFSDKEKQKLRKEIEETELLTEKTWLLEQLLSKR